MTPSSGGSTAAPACGRRAAGATPARMTCRASRRANHSRSRKHLARWALGGWLVAAAACGWTPDGPALPKALTAGEWWALSTSLSEPPGTFAHSENLVSNEIRYAHLARTLRRSGGVYLGVGPEQNFSYIARVRPQIAFIVDIRHENRLLHVLYKALFELARGRAEFLSLLFSRTQPEGIRADMTAADLFAAYKAAPPAPDLYEKNTGLVRDHLLKQRAFPLSAQDVEWIQHARGAFYRKGPDIHYGVVGAAESPGPTYAELMTASDIMGRNHSYLASEEDFAFVRQLHTSNLIVPVVGDFAGPHALRRIGEYVRQHGAAVETFYGSNVEVYLNRQRQAAFCRNLGALPHTSSSWFVGSKAMQRLAVKLKSCAGSAGQ